jgi:pyridoxamine 5'-phosphate oxidase
MSLPVQLLSEFKDFLAAAEKAGELEPTAMCLASHGLAGGVSARMVLLKACDENGFVFYTNLESDKGRQCAANPEAALTFHWKTIERQVRIEGRIEPVSSEEADAYFSSRDRGSQLGAWASDQSRPMSGKAELLARVARAEASYFASEVPRPPHWSGLRLVPHMIEFWVGRKSRLHDRYRHTLVNGEWQEQRLFP